MKIDIDEMLPGCLTLDCHKCTRTQQVAGAGFASSQRIAFDVGWRSDDYGLVCPQCPGGGEHTLSLELATVIERTVSQALRAAQTPWQQAVVEAVLAS